MDASWTKVPLAACVYARPDLETRYKLSRAAVARSLTSGQLLGIFADLAGSQIDRGPTGMIIMSI